MADLVNTLFNGLSLGSIYLLVALGLTITFGLMGVINMAHGEFVMIGAYMTFVMQQIFASASGSGGSLYYLLAIPFAFIVTFLLGCVMEKVLISRLYGRKMDSLLATWGISLILQQAARSIFGSQGVNVNAPDFLKSGVKIGACTFAYNRLFIIGLVIVCLLVVWLVMNKTKFGSQMRATMQNRQMAQCMGINSRKVHDLWTWFWSCGSGRMFHRTAWVSRFYRWTELHRLFVYDRCTWRCWQSGRNRDRCYDYRILKYYCGGISGCIHCKSNCIVNYYRVLTV